MPNPQPKQVIDSEVTIEDIQAELDLFFKYHKNKLQTDLDNLGFENTEVVYLVGGLESLFELAKSIYSPEQLRDEEFFKKIKIIFFDLCNQMRIIVKSDLINPLERMMNATNLIEIFLKKIRQYPQVVNRDKQFWKEWISAVGYLQSCADCQLIEIYPEGFDEYRKIPQIKDYKKLMRTELHRRTVALSYNPTLRNILIANIDARCSIRNIKLARTYLSAANVQLTNLRDNILDILFAKDELAHAEA